jgi:hypothetical protein
MYDSPHGSIGFATGFVVHWCAGSLVEDMLPLANRPFRGILVPADAIPMGVRSVGSGTCYSKINYRSWFEFAPLGGGSTYTHSDGPTGSTL